RSSERVRSRSFVSVANWRSMRSRSAATVRSRRSRSSPTLRSKRSRSAPTLTFKAATLADSAASSWVCLSTVVQRWVPKKLRTATRIIVSVPNPRRSMPRSCAARAASDVQSFTKRQPIVSACVLAYLEDDGQDAVGVGLQIALAVDGYYTRALGRPPSRVKPRVMDKALDDAEHALEQLVGVEPTLALRRSLFERDMTAPEIVVELIELIMA